MSAIAQTPAIKLEKTVDLEKIFEKIKYGSAWELLDIFDKWPLGQVRREVIQRLLDRPHEVYAELADGVEERIRQLRISRESDYWKPLLSWYIASSPPNKVAVKAIEFAIAFSEEFQGEWEVAKEVSRKLEKDPGLYWEAPSLRCFLDKLISGLRLEYFESQWAQAERAIRRIVRVRDITYLPRIEKLLGLFERGVYKLLAPHEGDEFTFGQNLQFLKDAVRILKQAEREQMPDLNVAVGSYLRERAGLSGSVIVRLEYPQDGNPANPTAPVEIVVKLELTDPAEVAKLAPVLKQCHVEWYGEGFTGTKLLGADEGVKGVFSRKCTFNDQLQCGFSTSLSRGSNRFWLTFLDGKKEFAKAARYLIVE